MKQQEKKQHGRLPEVEPTADGTGKEKEVKGTRHRSYVTMPH